MCLWGVNKYDHWEESEEDGKNLGIANGTRERNGVVVAVATVDDFLHMVGVRPAVQHRDAELVCASHSTRICQSI